MEEKFLYFIIIYIIMVKTLLPKKNGSRFEDVKTHCLNNELIGIESIKSAQESGMESNEFVHIIKSVLKNYEKPVIVKIHDSTSIYINKELLAIEELSTFKNAVKSICNFSCFDNKARWWSKTDSEKDVKFCSSEKDKLHFFVYEYIENADIEDFFKSGPSIMEIKNVLLQSALAIMMLGKKYNIMHGDLNTGNILFAKTDKKTSSYELDSIKYTVDTNGRIPKLIDFGRCKKIRGNANISIMDDVYILLSVLSVWITNKHLKTDFKKFILDESNKKTQNMHAFIQNFGEFFDHHVIEQT